MKEKRKKVIWSEVTDDEIRDMDFAPAHSADDVFVQRGVSLRSNVRFAAGKVVGYRDLDAARKKTARSEPKWLQLRKS